MMFNESKTCFLWIMAQSVFKGTNLQRKSYAISTSSYHSRELLKHRIYEEFQYVSIFFTVIWKYFLRNSKLSKKKILRIKYSSETIIAIIFHILIPLQLNRNHSINKKKDVWEINASGISRDDFFFLPFEVNLYL